MHRAMRVYLICFLSFFLMISAMTGGAIADITIDNGQAGTSFTGTWAVSGGTLPYGANSLWSRNGSTYTWSMSGQPSGTYEVFMWWSSWSTRATSVPVVITHAAGTTNITINQRQNGSSWYSLGTYTFHGSGSVRITAATGDMLSTCADAVWFHQLDSNSAPTAIIDSISPNPANPGQNVTFTGHGTDTDGTPAAYEWTSSIAGALSSQASFSTSSLAAGTHTITFRVRDDDGAWSAVVTRALTVGTLAQEFIIDNRDPQTARTGTWSVSTAPNPYGADSLWSRNGTTFTWFFVPPETGTYQVSMWWTAASSRSTSVPVTINHGDGSSTVTINQRQNGGRWNNLGVFDFVGGTSYRVTVTSRPGPSSTCSDAVKFNVSLPNNPPTAIIDTISPNPAQVGATVTFTGHGTDTDGTIAAYEWTSSIAGALSSLASFSTSSLTVGTHNISYRVRDDDGAWSSLVTRQLIIQATPPNNPPTAVIDSISPNPAEAGESVTFTGHGSDTDGTIAAYEWTSSISGTLSTQASFSTSALAAGTHTISFRVRDDDGAWSSLVTRQLPIQGTPPDPEEIIIDNRDAQTSQSPAGSWSISSAADPWGQDSHGRIALTQATFTWRFTSPATGYYEVFMWWTDPYNQDREVRQNAIVPVTINHADGATNTTVNQTRDWGQWNSLKVYRFDAGVTYNITITHPASTQYGIRTSADAVRFVRTDLVAPEALFGTDKIVGGAPVAVQFTDRSRGTVSSYLWNFGDGATSTARNPSHTYTAAGTYNVTLTASNSDGSDMEQNSIRITNGTEHVYLCDGYSKDALFIPHANELLADMGAQQQGGVWVYQNPSLNMTFYIHAARTPEAMTTALDQDGSHIIFNGHSNFGLGASFASAQEVGEQQIEDIRYIDDPRFTNFSSDMVSVKVDGVQYGQAYPNWEPFFQDGTSGIMPYDFDEGTPPYNYFMTYNIQGDPTAYMVELANGDYLERFPDSNVAPWYDETGRAPNPSNLTERQYFITNPELDFNYCTFTGTWPLQEEADDVKQYQGYNYQYHAAGSGANTARWNMYVKYPGTYEVRARWQSAPTNATNASYTIERSGGSTIVQANQTVASGSSGFSLGTYSFASGSYGITLTDNANGRVVADSMRLNPTFNPTKILQAEFGVSAISGVAPLVVDFTDMSLVYSVPSVTVTERFWDFGDGTTSIEQHPTHTYATPGVYTVSLRITDSSGATNTEVKTGIMAVGQTAPIRAQFNANRRRSSGRTIARFTDQSSGNITSWSWNFGDGTASTEQNPVHTYTEPGSYTVRLTVTGPGGSSTEEEINYVYNFVAGLLNDNVFRYKSHFGTSAYGKTILNTARSRIPQDQIRHARMFYGSCNSCNYYVGTFHQGVMYCTTSDSDLYTALDYLENYLQGMTDEQIVERLNRVQDIHEVLNFNLKPPSLR